MKHLGSIAGSGIAVAAGKRFQIKYEIDVFDGLGGLKSANGTLSGSAADILAMIDSDEVRLTLETGGSAKIVFRGARGTEADFLVSGPVPGF